MMSKKRVEKYYQDTMASAIFWKKGLYKCARQGNVQGMLNCQANFDRLYHTANVIRHILTPYKVDKKMEKVFE